MDDLSTLTTGGAWLSMFSSFLEDLIGQFPDDEEIKAAIVRANGGDDTIVDEFAGAVSGKQALLSAKDSEFFAGLKIAGVNFDRLWKLDMHDQSRSAIWSYFSSLSMIATTLKSIPPETLSMIENAARSIAGQFASSGGASGGMPDIGALMGMMGNLDLSGLGGMLGLPAPPPQQTRERLPAPPSAAPSRVNNKKRRVHKP
jgi:hypothetical protein